MTLTASLLLLVGLASLAEAKGTYNLNLLPQGLGSPYISPHGTVPITFTIGNYSQSRDTINSFMIYMDGTAHPATIDVTHGTGTWNWNRDAEQNPSEHFYYATAQVTSRMMPGSPGIVTNLDSRDPGPDGVGHRNDVILAEFRVNRLQYDGGFELYDRAGNQDVTKPQFVRHLNGTNWEIDRNYPAGFLTGHAPTVIFGISTTNLNNVIGQYDLHVDLAGESVTGYPVDLLNRALAADMGNANTLPALPNYLYIHHINLTVTLRLKLTETNEWVNYPTMVGGPDLTLQPDPGPTASAWLCPLADPNTTFPPYHKGGVTSNPLQAIPWFVIVHDAIVHAATSRTTGTTVTGVNDANTAMTNLTTDLYVFPKRPDGPAKGVSFYNPGQPLHYLDSDPDYPGQVVFALWDMHSSTSGDCQDFAAYLESEARSLGIASVAKQRFGVPYGGGFNYNPVIRCGVDPPVAAGGYFNFHQLSVQTGLCDFAIAFNYGDGIHPWTLALNYAESQESSSLVSSYPGVPSSFSSAFSLGGTDPVYFGKSTLIK